MKVHGSGLRALSITTAIVLVGAYALIAFWTPEDADQGIIQKIFYVHVPLAIVALCAFVAAAVMAYKYLTTGDRLWDLRSYVAIHLALILGVGVLVTGSIWARGSWGVWWTWDEPMLVSFLIVFLLYATYQPLRFSIEDPERQARYASVFAIVAGTFVPLNFAAVRMADSFIHPRTLGTTTGGMPGEMMLSFLLALLGMTLLFITLWKYEIAAKMTRGRIRSMRRRMLGDAIAPTGRSAAPQVRV